MSYHFRGGQGRTSHEQRTAERRQAKLRTLAETIRLAIAALPNDQPIEPAVVKVFADADATPSDKGDAFWLLDEKPGGFSGYPDSTGNGWHAKLRRTRNHPTHGHELFATFRS